MNRSIGKRVMSKFVNHTVTDVMIWAINSQREEMESLGADFNTFVLVGRKYAEIVMNDCGYTWPITESTEPKKKCKSCLCPMLDDCKLWLWTCPMCHVEVRREYIIIADAGHAPVLWVRGVEPELIFIITSEFRIT